MAIAPTGYREPETRYQGAGGSGYGNDSGLPPGSGPAPESPFGFPFAGWLALSDLIADANPELGDAMRAQAVVFRAALERSVADQFAGIRRILLLAGIPRWSVDDLERTLLSGALPLDASDLGEVAGQAYADLMQTGTVHPAQPEGGGMLASVMHYGALAVLGADADLGTVPPAGPPVRREDLPEAFFDYFLPEVPLRAAASLDLPAIASGQDFSIWCRSPLRRWRGDNLVAVEHTYVERDIDGLANPRFQDAEAPVTTRYRDDIGDWQPAGFADSIRPGVDNLYYTFRLTEPNRSRAAGRLREQLSQGALRQVLGAAVSVGVASGTAAAGPAGAVLAPVAATAAQALNDALLARLEAALADTNMIPWVISHTTLLTPEYPVGPLSMFVLASPGAPGALLHQVRRDRYDPDSSEMNLGYVAHVRSLQRGRGMVGLTRSPELTCPRDLWGQVATRNQPAAWTEPAVDNGGFRVLVPHAEPGKDASYVSALRADVLPAP
jgi:hypothetical protein